MGGNPNEGIIQRLPFSKVNMSDIKSLFWSETKLNINAAPTSTYVCSLLQDKLIKDQWELCVLSTCLLELQGKGTSANVTHLYQQWWCDCCSGRSKHSLMFTAMCHHKTNKPQENIFSLSPPFWHEFMYHCRGTQAAGRILCPKAAAMIKMQVTLINKILFFFPRAMIKDSDCMCVVCIF